MNRAAKFVICVLVVMCSGFVSGCKKTIQNPNSLPAMHQKHDFTDVYRGRDTDVELAGPPPTRIKYDQLDDDQAVGVAMRGGVFLNHYAYGFERDPVTGDRQLGEPADPDDPRPFHGLPGHTGDSKDWDTITDGSNHCSPTVAAMVLSYWAAEKGKAGLVGGLPGGAGAEVELIKRLAEYLDTNDQNPGMNNGDKLGHYGTFANDQIAGIPAYARANGGYNFTVTPHPFDFDQYKQTIKNSNPVIISFRNPGSKIGHVVVGYGYRGSKVLYKDPWDGASKEIPAANITSTRDVAGALARSYGQLIPLPITPSLASRPWIDALQLIVVEQVTP